MYKKLSSRVVFSHPRITLVEDQIELPDGRQGDYLWIEGGHGAVTVIPRDASGKILIEREYSYLPNEALYQFAGGGIHPGEEPEAAARRELAEELGLGATKLTLIGTYLLDHRRSHALMYIYVGEEFQSQIETTEDIFEVGMDSFWMSEQEIDELIASGQVVNSPMLSCWAIYKARKNNV